MGLHFVISFYLSYLTYNVTSLDYYVSNNGADDIDCGLIQNQSCGTLYYLSDKIDYSVSAFINIYINGQNESDITQYILDGNITHHPCLFKPLTLTSANGNPYFMVYFNAIHIQTMSDWFPQICKSVPINYQYMFEVQNVNLWVQFHNLIINDYTFNGYGILKVNATSTSLYNCTFVNISILSVQFVMQFGILDIYDTIFYNITSQNIDTVISLSLISDYNSWPRSIQFQRMQIENIWLHSSFVTVPKACIVTFIDNYCNNISVDPFLIDVFDNNPLFVGTANEVRIQHSVLLNLENGGVCRIQSHGVQNVETVLYVQNVTITTSQVELSNSMSLFKLWSQVGYRFTFNHFEIHYNYYLTANCNVSRTFSDYYSNVIALECLNPLQLIHAFQQMTSLSPCLGSQMESIKISMKYLDNNNNQIGFDEYRKSIATKYNFTANDINDQNLIISFYYKKQYELDTFVFVSNQRKISMSNITIYGNPIFNTFINFNRVEYILIRNFMVFYDDVPLVHNPNDLQSTYLIKSFQAYSMDIIHCDFSNAWTILHTDGTYNIFTKYNLSVYNSSFHDAFTAIRQTEDQRLLTEINFCFFNRLGSYYTNVSYYDNQTINVNSTHPLCDTGLSPYLKPSVYGCQPLVFFGGSLSMRNNTFTFYSLSGIFLSRHLDTNNGLIIQNNIFTVANQDNTIWYSKLKTKQPLSTALIKVNISSDETVEISLINNQFDNNYVNISIPMIEIESIITDAILCIAGNTFYNFVFRLTNIELSSCSRPQLYKTFAQSDYTNCSSIQYGEINSQLSDLFDVFLLNRNVTAIEMSHENNIALENVYINVSNNFESEQQLIFANINGRTNFLLKDSIIEGNVDIAYNPKDCEVICNQLYNNSDVETNQLVITQSTVLCKYAQHTPTNESKYVMDYNDTEYLYHLSPMYFMIENNVTYYAGGLWVVLYRITDKLNNTIPYSQLGKDIVFDLINDQLFLEQTLFVSTIFGCDICDIGIYIPSVIIDNVGMSYLVEIRQDIYTFIVNNITINIIECPSGFGANSLQFQCERCPNGQFSFTSEECYSCDEDINRGIRCMGGNEIIIKQSYWMGLMERNTQIISGSCAFGYCCLLSMGCDYLRNESFLCAENRDVESLSCSKCNDGYSELYLSTACGKCDGNYYGWLLVPFIISIFTVYLYILLNSDPKGEKVKLLLKPKKCQCNLTKMHNLFKRHKFVFDMAKIIVFNCIIYYQQAISQIFLNSNITINIAQVSAIFNLSIYEYDSTSEGGYCFINGMDAKQKIFSEFIVIIMMIFILFFCYLVYTFCKYTFSISDILLFDRRPCYFQTFIQLFLLCIGKIISILFKLLSCQSIGNITAHFYFAFDECYDPIWWLALFGLLIVILVFLGLFFCLKNMDYRVRQNENNVLQPLTMAYKHKFYYWELFIFFRRLIIAFLSVSFPNNNMYTKVILIIILCLFLKLQYMVQPFILAQINEIESNLLICTIVIVVIGMINDELDDIFVYLLIIVLIVMPFIMLIWFVVMLCRENNKRKHEHLLFEHRETELLENVKYTISGPLLDDEVTTYSTISSVNQHRNLTRYYSQNNNIISD